MAKFTFASPIDKFLRTSAHGRRSTSTFATSARWRPSSPPAASVGAARAVSLSQPALTQGLAKLEAQLGVRLFDRRPDGMRATPEPARSSPPARRRRWRTCAEATRALTRGGRGFARPEQLMTATQLRALVSLADAGSFVAASALTGLSQPALHRAVRDLEQICAAALAERKRSRRRADPGRPAAGARRAAGHARDRRRHRRARPRRGWRADPRWARCRCRARSCCRGLIAAFHPRDANAGADRGGRRVRGASWCRAAGRRGDRPDGRRAAQRFAGGISSSMRCSPIVWSVVGRTGHPLGRVATIPTRGGQLALSMAGSSDRATRHSAGCGDAMFAAASAMRRCHRRRSNADR